MITTTELWNYESHRPSTLRAMEIISLKAGRGDSTKYSHFERDIC